MYNEVILCDRGRREPYMTATRNNDEGKIFTPLTILFLSGNGIIVLAFFIQHTFRHVWWSDVLFFVMVMVGVITILTGVITSKNRGQPSTCDCQADRNVNLTNSKTS
jgi:hypothetical protein